MDTIIAFSANLKLDSLRNIKHLMPNEGIIIIVTSHKLLINEKIYLQNFFGGYITFIHFGEILSDSENAECDRLAYEQKPNNGWEYMLLIDKLKNEKIVEKLIEQYPNTRRLLLANDLGFDAAVWIAHGFLRMNKITHGLDYYLDWKEYIKELKKNLKKEISFEEDVYVGKKDGINYIFVGSLKRVFHFIDMPLRKSDKMRRCLQAGKFEKQANYQYLIPIHEVSRRHPLSEDNEIDVRYIQDGYMPPNYSAMDSKFHPKNVRYYAQDYLGLEYFANQDESATIPPFFKKLCMPLPDFPSRIKNVLFAVNCAGSWSAQINRSDDDLMVEAAVFMAMAFPEIRFIYRCHPTCTHPRHAGVDTINRIARYFNYMKLPNLQLSAYMPVQDVKNIDLSLGSSSLLEDIEVADLVVAEYSHSLIEAAMKKKLFASINLTNRRNFFESISNFGFPHCKDLSEMVCLIRYVSDRGFQIAYTKAVERYNKMIDGGFAIS